MKNLKGSEIRKLFLDYFESKGHQVVSSSSLVPADDPSLLFTNAGMVQFKKVFLGEETRPYKRAATSQKCVRAGGKHNDLENVGYTARHHTFFEMLGNFSFGDYFKREAIAFAWEFLTEVLELPKERLWATVFEDDDEAAAMWPEITGISPDRVVRLGEEDNFWAMGDTGPCGPCSEILIDQGEDIGCGRPECRVGCDCDRYLEIWNLVFMQFFRDESGRMSSLPDPCIDTGMGLERIAAVCQGKFNNFDTDIFAAIMNHLQKLSGLEYGKGAGTDIAMRVIADHARASAFLIADGVIPSNEGRGYVLRRIIRRAVRYGRVLGLTDAFMASVAGVVCDDMGDIYPELDKSRDFMSRVLENEETRFAETLETGLRILDERIQELKEKNEKQLPGDFVFKLYDTYGLPVDIVQDVVKEQGADFDREGYRRAREEQRRRSKSAHRDAVTEKLPDIYRELLAKGKGVDFSGYETLACDSTILALVSGQEALDAVESGWEGELVVETTPFYAESGGQQGDTGIIKSDAGSAEVLDTVKRGDLIVHKVRVISGTLRAGDAVHLAVTEGRRMDIARNHTATHLLHAALRQVLGDHVKQSGSLVAPDHLRFDFTHFSGVSTVELQKVEDIVNEKIRADLPVDTEVMSQEEAISRGAMALFGEKYGDTVRVVNIPEFSMELCGGTHLERTGQAGFFKITSESSVSAGLRRIEACTGSTAVNLVHQMENTISDMASTLKCPVTAVKEKVESLSARVKQLEKDLQKALASKAAAGIDDILENARQVNGITAIAEVVDVPDAKALREAGDRIRDRLKSGVVVLGAENNGKALLLCVVTKDLAGKTCHAGKIIKEVASVVGGGGGGRPDMAQAGGSRPEKLEEAVKKLYELL